VTINPLLDPAARLVIAHRGNRVAAPENTMEALRQAVELGVDAIEFDVRVTKDGAAVVLHDATLDRTTNGRGLLRNLTLAEVRALDAGATSPQARGVRHAIPTLEEVLDAFRSMPMVIEVKEFGAAAETERLVRHVGAEGRVLIGSAETNVMEWFYRTGLPSCASMLDAGLLLPLALAGIAPPKPMYDVLSLTPRFHGFPVPVRLMARAAKKSGIPTQVWTVNDPAEAIAFWEGGVAGIVTDDPAAILRIRSR
jgi:glycerophosphoryl diester phosphodiesterase